MTSPSLRRLIASQGKPAPELAMTTTVTGVVANGAAEGWAAVFVDVDGQSMQVAAYNANWTPTVGHVVYVSLVNNSPVILCRLVGFALD
jgi:hypothetical protein